MSSEQTLPERPAESSSAAPPAANPEAEGGEKKLSKNALKKLEKEREKVIEPILSSSTPESPLISHRLNENASSRRRMPPQKPRLMLTMSPNINMATPR